MTSSLKVVLDTNIFISALIHRGVARTFIFQLLSRNIKIALSNYIIFEVEEVLKRNKFKDREILESTPLRDPKDHPILKTAEIGKADYIITGDNDLLSLKIWNRIKILSMREFMNLILLV